MAELVYRRIPSTDPRLGRHVRHDPRSRAYAYPTSGLTLTSAKHARRIPVLDQGSVGSCTGNAGVGCLGTDPFYASLSGVVRVYTFGEEGARRLYSDAEVIDGDGPYPPNDNGSTGLSVAKALKAASEIAGYQHTFTLTDALLTLGQTPVITGVSWYEDMFNPDSDGRLRITGALAGGHEFVVDEIDAERERVWMTNSWGTSWGIGGRAYLTFDDWGRLLDDQGDAPTPAPPVDPDQALAAVAHPWVRHLHTPIAGDAHMKAALKAWLHAKGL